MDLTPRDLMLIGAALELAIDADKARPERDQRPSNRADMEDLLRLFPRSYRATDLN